MNSKIYAVSTLLVGMTAGYGMQGIIAKVGDSEVHVKSISIKPTRLPDGGVAAKIETCGTVVSPTNSPFTVCDLQPETPTSRAWLDDAPKRLVEAEQRERKRQAAIQARLEDVRRAKADAGRP